LNRANQESGNGVQDPARSVLGIWVMKQADLGLKFIT